MKAYKVVSKLGKIESYYIVCHNSHGDFQLVSIPWKRIDYRIAKTEESLINKLKEIVYKDRESTVIEVDLNIREILL